MWCSTLEVFTKFGTASDKVFYVLSPRFLCRSISCRQIQPRLRVGSLLPSQLARLPVNAAPDPVGNICPVSFGVKFQRLLQRGCHISGGKRPLQLSTVNRPGCLDLPCKCCVQRLRPKLLHKGPRINIHRIIAHIGEQTRPEVEAFLKGKKPSEEVAEAAAELAVKDAVAMSKNSYKIQEVKALIKKLVLSM